MTETEIRVNAMIAEYRGAIGFYADRCALLAAELASLQAKLKAMSEPKSADVVPIKSAE